MSTPPPDSRPPLGWPWDALADALLRWDAANRRAWAAQVAGDANTRNRAELDREGAWAEVHAVKAEVARQWLMGLRLAVEQEPSALAGLLGALPAADTVVESLKELEDRVDAVEDAVVKLETGGAVYR